MHLVGGRRVFAATDLSNFLSCAHLSGLARNVSRLPWLALALLAACSDAGQGVDSSIPVTELTSSRVLARDELRGEAAISVLPWNGRVFVGVMGADSVIAVYEPSGRVVRHYGPEGDGPGELRSPGNLVPWQDGIWIWDPRSGRGSILRPGGNPPIEPVWTIPDGERYLRAQPTDSGVVLSDSYFEPGLFSIWRQGMATPQPRGALPPLAAANWDTPWGLNPSYAVLSPDGERIAVVFSHTGEVVIASVPTGAVLATSRTSDWDIEIDAQEFRLLSPIGYVSAAAYGDAIYASWSGRAEDREAEGFDRFHVREVHVFDWQGALRQRLLLDRPGPWSPPPRSAVHGLDGAAARGACVGAADSGGEIRCQDRGGPGLSMHKVMHYAPICDVDVAHVR